MSPMWRSLLIVLLVLVMIAAVTILAVAVVALLENTSPSGPELY